MSKAKVLSNNMCTVYLNIMFEFWVYWGASISLQPSENTYFVLLSLGSSPSDDEEGDGEAPDWVLVWWLGNRLPPWVESYGADQSEKPILLISESLQSWDRGGGVWNSGEDPGPYRAFW